MDSETLKKANDLEKRIETLKKQREYYEEAKGIYEINLSKNMVTKTRDFTNVNHGFIDFEVLQTLALKRINTLIQEVENEFKNI